MSVEFAPEHLREEASAVVEHLNALRGAGLLLSGVDARLLVAWLESGVSTGIISLALERVTERRRERRVKARLCLDACKGEVKRLLEKGAPGRPAAPVRPLAAIDPPAGGLEALAEAAVEALDTLPPGDPATRAEAGMAIVRVFHRQAWEAAAAEHAALRAQAAEELAGLREGMDEGHWEGAVEEVARDLLRQRFPRLSAVAVWDRLQGL
ncbi:MAG: hypothetical protein ABIO70_20800 [Pseudomonadota bacterium]